MQRPVLLLAGRGPRGPRADPGHRVVVAVGLGLVAGTFALIVGTVAFMSKLVAVGIEEVPPMPREAVLSAGASRLQETATSVVRPAMPALVGSGLYMLDVNFRSSTILGLGPQAPDLTACGKPRPVL
jgi:ABC-type phosphate/phosphonate transport system permease subunit